MNNPNFSLKNAHTKQKSLQTIMVQSDCPTDGAASAIMLAHAIPKAAIEREQREFTHFVEREQARRSQS